MGLSRDSVDAESAASKLSWMRVGSESDGRQSRVKFVILAVEGEI